MSVRFEAFGPMTESSMALSSLTCPMSGFDLVRAASSAGQNSSSSSDGDGGFSPPTAA